MTQIALIQLGPAPTAGLINSTAERRTLYDQIKMLPKIGAAVVVDHDPNRPVGEVLDVFTMDWPEPVPDARWLFARARIDHPPAWLERGSGASISFIPTFVREAFGWEVVREGWLKEVTLCSPTHIPVEELARVVTLREERASDSRHSSAVGPSEAAADEYLPATGGVIRRVFETTITIR